MSRKRRKKKEKVAAELKYTILHGPIHGYNLYFDKQPKWTRRVLRKALRKLRHNVDQQEFRQWAFSKDSLVRVRNTGKHWTEIHQSDLYLALNDIWLRLYKRQKKGVHEEPYRPFRKKGWRPPKKPTKQLVGSK